MTDRDFPAPIFDDAIDARARAAAARKAEIARRRAENRAAMPIVSAFFDKYEAEFPGCKVIWAIEGDRVVGTPPPEALARIRPTESPEGS